MREIDIGALSAQSGVSTSAIRFYESKGLLKSIGRKGLRRQYSLEAVYTLALIKRLKKSGLALSEIGEICIENSKIKISRHLIDDKVEQIEQKIKDLEYLLDILQHIQSCPYEDHLACPQFIKLLD